MNPQLTALVTIAAAAVLTTVFCCAVRPLLGKFKLLDVPNHRSSHEKVTPRGGGIAVILGFGVAYLAASVLVGVPISTATGSTFAAILVLGAVGLIEDVYGLSVRQRLVIQGLVSGCLAGALLAPDLKLIWLAIPLAFVGITFVNAANFMDGVNGISSFHGVATGVTATVVGFMTESASLAILGATFAGAFLGFLPWNFPKAQMFLGDVGSYTLGAGAFGIGLLNLKTTGSLLIALAPVAVYLADVSVTLAFRARSGQPLTEAHNQHLYQFVKRKYDSHIRSSLFAFVPTVLICGVSLMNLGGLLSRGASWSIAVALVAAYLFFGIRVRLTTERKAVQ